MKNKLFTLILIFNSVSSIGQTNTDSVRLKTAIERFKIDIIGQWSSTNECDITDAIDLDTFIFPAFTSAEVNFYNNSKYKIGSKSQLLKFSVKMSDLPDYNNHIEDVLIVLDGQPFYARIQNDILSISFYKSNENIWSCSFLKKTKQ